VQLIEFLNENQEPDKSRAVNPLLAQMKETLDAINLKPEKGRRKDLRRIEQAVQSMRKLALSNKKDD
jgi:hypothetical protein